jgi:CRISPR-associated endonuclease Csn1
VRASLHKQNYIGAIAQPKIKDGKPLQDNGKFILQKDADGKITRFYVKRNPVTKDFSASDVKKIVDKAIKKRIEKHGLKNVRTKDGHILLPAEKKGENGNDKNLKEMLIKKIRLFEKDKPIEVKTQNEVNLQTPKALRKKHKHFFYAQNNGNYCMAIYEGKNKKGKPARAYELINNLDAGNYYKLSHQGEREMNELVPRIHLETGYKLVLRKNEPLTIKKGVNIILLKNRNEEPEWMNQSWLNDRFYTITGIDDDGIKLYYHQEARPGTEVLKFMNEVINEQKFKNVIPDLKNIDGINVAQLWKDFYNPQIKKKDFFEKIQKILNEYYEQYTIKVKKKNREEVKKIKLRKSGLTTPKGKLEDFINNHNEFPYVKLKVNDFNAFIEGIDFKITPTGKIEKI